MSVVRKTLANLQADRPRLSKAQAERLDAITDEEIERAAALDPDAPLLSDAQLDRMALARLVRETRAATGLSQTEFARQFHIHPSRVRDWEQGRFKPDDLAQAYMKVIRAAPDMVRKAIDAAE